MQSASASRWYVCIVIIFLRKSPIPLGYETEEITYDVFIDFHFRVKIRIVFLEYIGSIAPDVAFHDVMKKEYENPQNGASAHKHILQQVGCK